MADIQTHHLIYGSCLDVLSGDKLVDTDDERLRQRLYRMMLEEKGYRREELVPRRRIDTLFAGRFVSSLVDLSFFVHGRCFMILRYGPGSLVSRERPAIAAARVLEPDYIIPLAVVTNGRDAELLDSHTGRVQDAGFAAIPDRAQAQGLAAKMAFTALRDAAGRERELRILNAFDHEICCAGCPCPLPGAPEG